MIIDDFRHVLLEYTFAIPMVGILQDFDLEEQIPLFAAITELAKHGMISE